MKFSIGNKVRVKDSSRYEKGMFAGRKGIVVSLHKGAAARHPYNVEFGNTRDHFHANELERVEL